MSSEQGTILIIEDEASIVDLVRLYVEEARYTLVAAEDGPSGLTAYERIAPDLIILDLMLPGMDGYEVCKRIRAQGHTPILMLTARRTEDDRVMGLDLGADDYLTKPFSLAELLARVKALLRRADLLRAAQANAAAQPQTLRNGDLEILPTKRQVRYRGESLDFTALEFDLLLHFAQHPGHVFSRGQLLNAVWGYTHDGYEHTVTTHINRLRAKLEEDPMRPRLILTVRGAGYKMREPPA
jgi:DNA-binding response OmpR family regulator